MSKFTHLHLHTEYSTLDGINRVDTLPEYIKNIGQDACAITDHGNISGSYKFFKSCKRAGIKPIIGIEAYYTVNDRRVKEKDDLEQNYYHLVLLAQNNTGLKNLYKLSTYAFTEGKFHKPRIDDELLAQYNEGILATSSCLGSRSSQLMLRNEWKQAERLLDHHAAIFKDRFYLELQLHHDDEQQKVNKGLLEVAKRKGYPIILSNDCHYTHPDDKKLHEEALCMQTNNVMSDPKRFSFGDIDVHVASHDWMAWEAKEQNIPYEAISNTQYISSLIDDTTYFMDRMNRYPKYQKLPQGVTSWEALEHLSKHGLMKKMEGMPPEHYRQRLDHELKAIKKMGFSDYMLIMWDLLEGARSVDVFIGPGRGSAGGSLVAYALDITQVDPIEYDLVFERFLNPGRAGLPLIYDLDMIKQIEKLKAETQSKCTHHH